ncbi:MAG TPA: T9SS type B sorting domain-containing protein [Salegentibacter sp.]|uniref:T9SS type B sorting domain-containing protein n=1 Tax=Salegentibacter sp. TaxID=1903072 RepID=UPI002F931384
MKYLFLFAFFITTYSAFSQLGSCKGSKGEPIFHEDFTGGGPLLPGTTNYNFVDGHDPYDGEYTISNEIGKEIGGWFSYLPNTTISNGNALIINAEYTAGQFYEYKVSGLCENTSYEFSAFLINILSPTSICEDGGIPINVKFQIWDQTDTEILAEGSTGDIQSKSVPQWEEYALTFKSEPGQASVILRMYNNSDGGCGNDLAIDDIIFRSCGDLTEVSTSMSDTSELFLCEENAPISLDLTATPDFSAYDDHYFQWQESTNKEDWDDIPGEITNEYTTPQLSSSRFYRVKVAEDPVNLVNNLCSTVSEPFLINIVETPKAPVSLGDKSICRDEEIPSLSVEIEDDETVNWYASETGSDLLQENSRSFIPPEEGVYYAEAIKTGFECAASKRTPLKLEIYELPEAEEEELQICAQGVLELDAGLDVSAYEWSTGETTRKISVSTPGNYKVALINSNGCSAIKNIEVTTVDLVGIEKIISEERKLIINPLENGEFEYSIDGDSFQDSREFDLPGGVYTIYMRDKSGCSTISQEFPHLVFPRFITPNGDGYNDVFRVKGLEFFSRSRISIYDQYGKLLKSGKGQNFSWEGKLDGRELPSTDYWYTIKIENFPVQKGHFSLIR